MDLHALGLRPHELSAQGRPPQARAVGIPGPLTPAPCVHVVYLCVQGALVCTGCHLARLEWT